MQNEGIAFGNDFMIVGAIIDRPRALNKRPYILHWQRSRSDSTILHFAFYILHFVRSPYGVNDKRP